MSNAVSEDVSGEQIRRNLTESELGIPLTLNFQVVDYKTCLPLQDVAVDIWGCNTTVRSTERKLMRWVEEIHF